MKCRLFIVSGLFLLSTAFLADLASADESGSVSLVRATELSAAFRQAADKVVPATVKIISRLQTPEDRRAMEIQIPALKTPLGRRAPGDSTGTGVIISPQGMVVTNNHVVANARDIEVELPDGRNFRARKYQHDPSTDLAVIWLDLPPQTTLPFASFGDSDLLDVGDWVLAIGNPFDMDTTVSAGIISAKGRSINRVRRTEFLQTDAAINPGNSGGPLVNLKGEIIGINTAIASRTGTYEGIGFALPSNNAQWITDQLIRHDRVHRSWLGVETRPVLPEDVRRFNLRQSGGLVVEYPLQNSPAAESGLQSDDVILSFNGQPVNAVYQLQRLAERAEIDKEHEIIYSRAGSRYRVAVYVKPLPPSQGLLATPQGGVASYVDTELGLLLVQSTDQILGSLRLQGHQGMLVIAVLSGSRAERAGINIGTLITQIDGKPVPNRQQYIAVRATCSLSDGIVFDTFLPHGGGAQPVVIRLGQ
jgi:serine protease Do